MRLVFFSILLFTLTINSQTTNFGIEKLTDDVENLSNNKASESIYLQTSKDIYETGEDLWFKAYVLDSKFLTPSDKSRTLFIQLIENTSNIPVLEEKYDIENGFVNGHLILQDSLKQGNYTLAAYSSNSFYNNKETFNAFRKIQVLKSIQTKTIVKLIKQDSVAQFNTFPEGGNLVSGVENKLAFKAVNALGNPAKVAGVLYENNKPLIHFKSNHLGTGSLLFNPRKNNSYYIKLLGSEPEKKHAIPKIFSTGKVMRLLSITPENIFFQISQSPNLNKENIHIRVQSRGVVYNLATAIIKKDLRIKIPIKDIPQGITEVTLFNKDFEPICERLVYINSYKKLNIQATLSKGAYKTREKGQLKIKVSDELGNPVIAHLGLSIFDRIYKNKKDSKSIKSHYYLSTQLKGKLYNPTYYFNTQNKDRKEALDLLLLTQGWRRYVWSETNLEELKSSKQVLSEELEGTAKIIQTKKSKQIGQPIIKIFNPELKEPDQFIILDSLGKFMVNSEHLKLGERNYSYFKFMVPQNSKHNFTIKNNWFKTINDARSGKQVNFAIENFRPLEEENIIPFKLYANIKELDEVVLNTNKRKIVRDKYLSKLDSIVRLEIIDWIAEPCRTLNCPFHPYVEGNEIPVEGKIYTQYVSEYYENNQRKEIRKKVLYKKPVITDEYLMSRFNLIRIKGYYGKREFYQPVYDLETIKDPFPDYRNTLFWKPDIITNKQGEAVIDFYCSDINSIFLGEIEGVNGEGLLGTANFDFAIRKRED